MLAKSRLIKISKAGSNAEPSGLPLDEPVPQHPDSDSELCDDRDSRHAKQI